MPSVPTLMVHLVRVPGTAGSMRLATPAIRQVQIDQIRMLSGGAVTIGMSSSRVSAASPAVRRHGLH